MIDSNAVLADYVNNRSEQAFEELVRRYIGLVYSTACRMTNDVHLAEDIAQTVFLHLAQKAAAIPSDVMLGGWLHRDACYVALKAMRKEQRRRLREKQAMELKELNGSAQQLAQLAPVLDDAVNSLAEEDRKAILLRFYEGLDFRSVGQVLGSSENAAQKRVSRALAQLHSILTNHGVGISTTALAAVLTGRVAMAVPAGLAANIAAAALANTPAAPATVLTFVKLMTVTKLKLGVAALVVAAAASHLVLQWHTQVGIRARDNLLRWQDQQISALTAEAQRLSNLVLTSQSLTGQEMSELARLRSEVTQQHQRDAAFIARASTSQGRQAGFISKTRLARSDFSTPEAALESAIAAMSPGNYEQALAALAPPPELAAESETELNRKGFEEEVQAHGIRGILMVAKKILSEDKVDIEAVIFWENRIPAVSIQHMVKIGDQWKFAGSAGIDDDWETDGQIQSLLARGVGEPSAGLSSGRRGFLQGSP